MDGVPRCLPGLASCEFALVQLSWGQLQDTGRTCPQIQRVVISCSLSVPGMGQRPGLKRRKGMSEKEGGC